MLKIIAPGNINVKYCIDSWITFTFRSCAIPLLKTHISCHFHLLVPVLPKKIKGAVSDMVSFNSKNELPLNFKSYTAAAKNNRFSRNFCQKKIERFPLFSMVKAQKVHSMVKPQQLHSSLLRKEIQ